MADLERLGSSDGLYTAPRIKQAALLRPEYSLADTAYADAALELLGKAPPAPNVARLRVDATDGRAALGDGTCDLESTLIVVDLRTAPPAAAPMLTAGQRSERAMTRRWISFVPS